MRPSRSNSARSPNRTNRPLRASSPHRTRRPSRSSKPRNPLRARRPLRASSSHRTRGTSRTRNPLDASRPSQTLWPRHPLSTLRASRPLRPSRSSRPCSPHRPLRPNQPHATLRQHPPRCRTRPRRVPQISCNQRNIARSLIRNNIIHPIHHGRVISPPKTQSSHPSRAGSRRPLRPNRPSRPHQTLRSRRPNRSLSPRRPRRSCIPLRPLRPNRPSAPRNQRHLQLRRMPRQIILLTVELHRRRPRRQSNPIIRPRSIHPSLHQRSHIHRHISPGPPHLHHLHRTPQHRQRLIRHAVLTPHPAHRQHAHRPSHIHPIAIQPQHRPRNLPRRRPHRQRRKIELQQSRITCTHIQIRDRPAIHPRPSAVHMGIRHQRRLHRNRWPSRSQPRPRAHPNHQHLPSQAHPTIQSQQCTSPPENRPGVIPNLRKIKAFPF